MCWLVFLAVCCGGCGSSSLEYQGWSPSFRYTRDDPGLNDIYYGIDANFVVAEPLHRPPTVARAEPVDPWNSPVAYQPLTAPVLNPIQEAGVSTDAAVDNK